MFIIFLRHENDHANMITVRWKGGRSYTSFIPKALLNSSAFGNAASHLHVTNTHFTGQLETMVGGLSPSGLKEKVPNLLAPVANSYRAFTKAGLMRSKDLDAKKADWMVPKFTDSASDAVRRVEIRSRLYGMKVSELLPAVFTNREFAAAFIEGGQAMSGLSNDLWQKIERKFAELTLADRYDGHPGRNPTADDPLAYGPDRDSSKKMAADALAAYDRDLEEVNDVKRALQSTINLVAAIADVKGDDAFALINNAK